MQVILQWYWECPHPCPYRSIGATFVKILKLFRVVQKVSGRVQEGPWSSPDPIKKNVNILDNLIFNSMFLLPIMLAIGPVIHSLFS